MFKSTVTDWLNALRLTFRRRYLLYGTILTFCMIAGIMCLLDRIAPTYQLKVEGRNLRVESVEYDAGRGFRTGELQDGKWMIPFLKSYRLRLKLQAASAAGGELQKAVAAPLVTFNAGKPTAIEAAAWTVKAPLPSAPVTPENVLRVPQGPPDGPLTLEYCRPEGTSILNRMAYRVGSGALPASFGLFCGVFWLACMAACWVLGSYGRRIRTLFSLGELPRGERLLYKTAYLYAWYLLLAMGLPILGMVLRLPLPFRVYVPAALILSLATIPWRRREWVSSLGALALLAAGLVAAVLLSSLWVEPLYDSIRSHIPAIGLAGEGWNWIWHPYLLEVTRGSCEIPVFTHALWQSKGGYALAAGMFSLTGNMMSGSYFLLLMLILSFAVANCALRGVIRDRFCRYMAVAAAALNPIALSELFTNGTDSTVAAGMTIFCLAWFGYLTKRDRRMLLFLVVSGVLTVSAKNTGIAYIGIISFAGTLWMFCRKFYRKNCHEFLAAAVLACIIGVICNLNPFVTNLAIYGNCMFPIMGKPVSDEFVNTPRMRLGNVYASNRDKIEMMDQMSNPVYFAYTQLLPGQDPRSPALIDFSLKQFFGNNPSLQPHVCGFGSLYRLAFLIGAGLTIMLLIRRKFDSALLLLAAILVSFLVNPQVQEARYIPQAWLVPLFAVLAVWQGNRAGRMMRHWATTLCVVMVLGSLIQIPGQLHILLQEKINLNDNLAAPREKLYLTNARRHALCNLLAPIFGFDRAAENAVSGPREVVTSLPRLPADRYWCCLCLYKNIVYYVPVAAASPAEVATDCATADFCLIEKKTQCALPDEIQKLLDRTPSRHSQFASVTILEKGRQAANFFHPDYGDSAQGEYKGRFGWRTRGYRYGFFRSPGLWVDGRQCSLLMQDYNIVTVNGDKITAYGNWKPDKMFRYDIVETTRAKSPGNHSGSSGD